MTKLDEIMTDDYLSAKEKLEKIEDYRRETLEEVRKAQQKIKSEFSYCPQCRDWYKEKMFEFTFEKKRVQICTNPYADGPYQYEDHDVITKIKECPKGHKSTDGNILSIGVRNL